MVAWTGQSVVEQDLRAAPHMAVVSVSSWGSEGAGAPGWGMLGGSDEPARDRRPGGARRRLLDLAADRLQPVLVAASRQLGEHTFKGELVQRLGRGERLSGRQGQLGGPVGAAHPRPVNPGVATAEGDLAGLPAVADRGPVRVVAALGGPTSRSTSASSRLPSTPKPVSTARTSSPSRAAPANSASATVTAGATRARRRRAGSSAYPSACSGGGGCYRRDWLRT
jgi:hypothetical protein